MTNVNLNDCVVVEYMPPYLRESHAAAGNRGFYPHNGAERYTMTREDAAVYVDGDWCFEVAGADPAAYEQRVELG